MHHASGALTSFHAVASGASVFVMQQFDVAEVGRVLSEERIGFVMLVPAMIRALLEDEEVCSRSYSDLRTVFYGASAISPSTALSIWVRSCSATASSRRSFSRCLIR